MDTEPIIISVNLPNIVLAIYALSYLFGMMLLIKVARWFLP